MAQDKGSGHAVDGAISDLANFLVAAVQGKRTGALAFQGLKIDDEKSHRLARKAVIELLGDILSDERVRDGLRELCREHAVWDALVEAGSGSRGQEDSFADSVKQLVECVKSLKKINEEWQAGDFKELISSVLPPGALRYRYRSDRPDEKALLAQFVARTFFRSAPLRCFVQASTTAIHLGEELVKNRSVARGCLLHTNSVVFPLTVLREGGPHFVYTFCGPSFDELCGGWLFPSTDSETKERLCQLFRRDKDPLTTAFIMPMATTVTDGPFFRRNDTAELVRILLEEAKHCVLITTADRVYADRDALPEGEVWCASKSWSEIPSDVSLVIGPPRNEDFLRQFRDQPLEVHWLSSPMGEQDEELTGHETDDFLAPIDPS